MSNLKDKLRNSAMAVAVAAASMVPGKVAAQNQPQQDGPTKPQTEKVANETVSVQAFLKRADALKKKCLQDGSMWYSSCQDGAYDMTSFPGAEKEDVWLSHTKSNVPGVITTEYSIHGLDADVSSYSIYGDGVYKQVLAENGQYEDQRLSNAETKRVLTAANGALDKVESTRTAQFMAMNHAKLQR